MIDFNLFPPGKAAVVTANELNRIIAEWNDQYPDRFVWFPRCLHQDKLCVGVNNGQLVIGTINIFRSKGYKSLTYDEKYSILYTSTVRSVHK